MTLRRCYKTILFLPFVLPLLVGAVCWLVTGYFTGIPTDPRPDVVMPFSTLPVLLLSGFAHWLVAGLIYGGLPYLLFVFLLLLVYRHRDTVFWGRLTFMLPLLFAPFAVVAWTFYGLPYAVSMGFNAIILGYLYVVLAHFIVRRLLKRRLVIDEG